MYIGDQAVKVILVLIEKIGSGLVNVLIVKQNFVMIVVITIWFILVVFRDYDVQRVKIFNVILLLNIRL